MTKLGGLLASLTLFATILLMACSSDESGGSAGTGATATAPATAAAPTPTATPETTLTKDDLGRDVTPPQEAQRVVAMSPTVVELLYAVGAAPVGRPSSADYPEAARSVPDFGASYQPNFEIIASMKPDLIIADAIIDEGMIDQLAKLGAPVFAVRVASFDGVTKGLRTVGALTGKREAGEREAKALDDKLASILARKPATTPNVLVIVGGGPTQIFAARDDAYVSDIIRRLGGKNVISSEPETFRLPGFSDFSLERIIEKDPDVIIAISPGPANAPKTTDGLSQSPVWSSLKAVKAGRVFEVDPTVYLQSAGPRVSLMLDELSRILYPDVFKASAR